MRTVMPLLFIAALICATMSSFAQDEPKPPDETGVATVGPAAGEKAAPAEGGQDTTEALQRDALRELLGEPKKPEPVEKPAAPETGAGATTSGSTGRTRTGSNSSSSARSVSPSTLPAGSIPEVPAVPTETATIETPTRDDATASPDADPFASLDTPAPPAGGLSDAYRTPLVDTTDTIVGATADAAVSEEATPAAPGASAAFVIIITLIVLAALLALAAAVYGIMGARQGPPMAAAAGAAEPGWAYLSAPEAPDISLQKTPFLVGSSPACDLRLADPKASPHHARIDRTAGGYVLTDLNSTNGTYLNDERIASPVSLRPGDEVRMGDIVVNFEMQL